MHKLLLLLILLSSHKLTSSKEHKGSGLASISTQRYNQNTVHTTHDIHTTHIVSEKRTENKSPHGLSAILNKKLVKDNSNVNLKDIKEIHKIGNVEKFEPTNFKKSKHVRARHKTGSKKSHGSKGKSKSHKSEGMYKVSLIKVSSLNMRLSRKVCVCYR
uniref:Cnidarian restricted protein n=1 Tax=Clytia hemisphaerica TaxID=252671 RepID=A0A7M5VC80_9CNID